jgi:neutral ceramidase
MRKTWMLAFLAVLLTGASGAAEIPLEAGLANADITPVTGVPLAGYGGGKRRLVPWDILSKYKYATFLHPSEGKHDPIRVKVMWLRRGEANLLFMSLDLVGVTEKFVDDIAKHLAPLGLKREELFIAGTHTHSGPGTLSKELPWELLAMDKYQKKIYARAMAQIVQTVTDAKARLEPAHLYSLAYDVKGIQRNRRIPDGPVDNHANALLAWADRGEWLGGMINLAVHGTALKTDNMLFSADLPGGLERGLEKRLAILNVSGGVSAADAAPPTVLFVNGAEADVTPTKTGFAGIDELGESFAEQTAAALGGARLIEPAWSVRHASVDLGRPAFQLGGCVKIGNSGHLPEGVKIGLSAWLPKRAPVSVITLGDMKLMAWPGEPTTALGFALKDAARQAGARQAWVLGLTNGYLAYFTTPEEWALHQYEGCSALYGNQGGNRVLAGLEGLLAH